jgi:hypothetical protein
MRGAWPACILNQAYEDMQHAAPHLSHGDAATVIRTTGTVIALRRVLFIWMKGGFWSAPPAALFAVVGLHKEAYSAEDGGAYDALLSLDPILNAWAPHEIAQEAGYLSFFFPAIREYLNSGPREEQERRKRPLIANNRKLFPLMREADSAALENLALNEPGLKRDDHSVSRNTFTKSSFSWTIPASSWLSIVLTKW